MNALRIDARIAAAAIVALGLAGAAPQWATAQGAPGGEGNCQLWSPLEAAAKAVDPKAAAAAARAIELEPRCNRLAADANKAVVDVYRALDARLERQKVAQKDQVKHLQSRMTLLEEALTFWDAYDINIKIAELQAKLPGKKDHAKIGMALDRALVALDEMPEKERPARKEIARMARLAYQHEALAAAGGTPIQRESAFRNIVTGSRQIDAEYVPAPLQFEYNKAELTIHGEAQAKVLLTKLRERDMPALNLIGHTDPDGTFEHNDELSLRRAAAIKKYLEDNGYPRGRITIAGRGKRDVAAFESQIENRDSLTKDEIHQILRRVELKFVK
jgi:outer membrane protein OmpA-like peptidoglycan-associated protein